MPTWPSSGARQHVRLAKATPPRSSPKSSSAVPDVKLEEPQSLATKLCRQIEGEIVATFVLIHGAGDVGWYWHLVEAELRARSHESIAPDLPCDDDSAGLPEYANTVVDAIGDRQHLVVVGQSLAGFTAPIVCD